jgi:hypothetical protein
MILKVVDWRTGVDKLLLRLRFAVKCSGERWWVGRHPRIMPYSGYKDEGRIPVLQDSLLGVVLVTALTWYLPDGDYLNASGGSYFPRGRSSLSASRGKALCRVRLICSWIANFELYIHITGEIRPSNRASRRFFTVEHY